MRLHRGHDLSYFDNTVCTVSCPTILCTMCHHLQHCVCNVSYVIIYCVQCVMFDTCFSGTDANNGYNDIIDKAIIDLSLSLDVDNEETNETDHSFN